MATRQDKKAREQLEKAIMEFAPMVTLDQKISFDNLRSAIRIFMRKHPEIFWFSNQYQYNESSGILRLKYNFTKEKADFFKDEIEKVVKDDFQIDYVKNLSETDRLVYVYKWIANRTTYNEYSSFNQTIYSVLINRNSVCTGYAKTAQYLLGLVGIESALVFGKFHSDKSEHGRHGWNIVKIGDSWYHVDFCLADSSLSNLLNTDETPRGDGSFFWQDSILWNYFGVSTDKVLSNRSIELIETLPECKNTLIEFSDVDLPGPKKRLICCKSDSGSTSKIFLDSLNKNRVVKVPRNGRTDLLDNEAAVLSKFSDCLSSNVINSYGLNDCGLELEQLTPWSELLNSHYYNPTETDLKNILGQLIEGLDLCSRHGISYSDIHYNNVFVTKDGTYKWGDFGIAFHSRADGKLPPEMIGENGKAKGSLWFMAPETYHHNVFTEASAIYSVAMMAYFVMNDMRPPFWTDDVHRQEAISQRLDGKDIPAPVFADRFRDLWPVINRALSQTIESRPCSFHDFILQIDPDYFSISVEENTPYDDSLIFIEDNDCFINYSFADSDSFASTAGPGLWHWKPCVEEDFATTEAQPVYVSHSCSPCHTSSESANSTPLPRHSSKRVSYGATTSAHTASDSIWSRLFSKKEKTVMVNASAYAPAEVMPHKYFIVRIFIHRSDEADNIDQTVKDVDKTAVKKANKPLDVPVRRGYKITVGLSMSDGVKIDEPVQDFVWRGHYIECDVGCELIKENLHSVLGKAIIAINNVPCGDLKFTIDIVSAVAPTVYARVDTRRYSKIFISYAHADYHQVRGIAEGCKMNGTDYFFDRHTLQAGDIFKEKILRYIDNADLFVLCWSKNAAESEWVQIERKHALELIERGNHKLAIYPLSMPPEAPLPADMSDKYNFATL